MDCYEALGRERLENRNLLDEYRKLLDLVGRIKAGEVDPEHVEILPGDAWRINVVVDGSDLRVEPEPP